MTEYTAKKDIYTKKIKELLSRLNKQNLIVKNQINLIVFDDEFNYRRVQSINGIDFRAKPGVTNVFVTHQDNKFASCKCFALTYDNLAFIDKSQHVLSGLLIDLGSKSTLYIDRDLSCGGIEIRLREHHDVLIGEDCMFSSNISIWTSDGHAIFDKEGKLINVGGDVIIGDHVWVGHGVKFLKKTFINNDSVVGSSSLVTKQFSEKKYNYCWIPS